MGVVVCDTASTGAIWCGIWESFDEVFGDEPPRYKYVEVLTQGKRKY